MAEDEHLIWLFRQDDEIHVKFCIRTAADPLENATVMVRVRRRGCDDQLVAEIGNATQRWLERKIKASFGTFERRYIAAESGGKPS